MCRPPEHREQGEARIHRAQQYVKGDGHDDVTGEDEHIEGRALYNRVGAATLFDGAWRLLPVAERGHIPRGYHDMHLATIMTIPDGGCLAAAVDLTSETMHWITCRVAARASPLAVMLASTAFTLLPR